GQFAVVPASAAATLALLRRLHGIAGGRQGRRHLHGLALALDGDLDAVAGGARLEQFAQTFGTADRLATDLEEHAPLEATRLRRGSLGGDVGHDQFSAGAGVDVNAEVAGRAGGDRAGLADPRGDGLVNRAELGQVRQPRGLGLVRWLLLRLGHRVGG